MADPNREQGPSAEQRDRGRQHDPGAPAEGPSFQSAVDLEDPGEPASGGMQQGGNHTRREGKDRIMAHGKKTLAAQRAQPRRST